MEAFFFLQHEISPHKPLPQQAPGGSRPNPNPENRNGGKTVVGMTCNFFFNQFLKDAPHVFEMNISEWII